MMRVRLIAVVLLSAATGAAQEPSRRYSRPVVPTTAALDRLHLVLAWRSYLPMDGLRDGIEHVQRLGNQLLVQLRSGTVISLDAETGQIRWQTRLGVAYHVGVPPGHNDTLVLIANGTRLFALDRATGRQLWEFDMPNVPSTPPVADADKLYLCFNGGQFDVYQLPPRPAAVSPGPQLPTAADLSDARKGRRGLNLSAYGQYSNIADHYRRTTGTPQPHFLFEHRTETHVTEAPMLSAQAITLVGGEGSFFVSSKDGRRPLGRYHLDLAPAAPLGHHGPMIYVAGKDGTIAAISTLTGKTIWRFHVAAATVFRRLEVTDEDVFAASDSAGLYRLRRDTGELVWHTPAAHRFLARNRQYVYALDRTGRLLVLDLARGTPLGALDTRDFTVAVSNEVTDRIYLGAHDGLLLALHDRNLRQPLVLKSEAAPKPTDPPAARPAEAPVLPSRPNPPAENNQAMENKAGDK